MKATVNYDAINAAKLHVPRHPVGLKGLIWTIGIFFGVALSFLAYAIVLTAIYQAITHQTGQSLALGWIVDSFVIILLVWSATDVWIHSRRFLGEQLRAMEQFAADNNFTILGPRKTSDMTKVLEQLISIRLGGWPVDEIYHISGELSSHHFELKLVRAFCSGSFKYTTILSSKTPLSGSNPQLSAATINGTNYLALRMNAITEPYLRLLLDNFS